MIEEESFLAVIGSWVGKEGYCGLVNVHGPSELKERTELWKKLEMLVAKEEVKWCVFRDFNEVRGSHERINSRINDKGAEEFNV